MKNPIRLFAILAVILFAAFLAVPVTHASDAITTAATLAAPVAAPWYANTDIISGAFAIVVGLIAIWKNDTATKAQKINKSLVLGIEAATKIPAVADGEKLIKAKIKQFATDNGVQPLLDRLVQDLTDPAE